MPSGFARSAATRDVSTAATAACVPVFAEELSPRDCSHCRLPLLCRTIESVERDGRGEDTLTNRAGWRLAGDVERGLRLGHSGPFKRLSCSHGRSISEHPDSGRTICAGGDQRQRPDPDAGTPQGGADPNPPNAPDQRPAFAGQTRAPVRASNVAFAVVTVAEGLQTPWGMAFLPGGRILVTEKPAGRLRIIGTDGKLSEAVAGLPAVDGRNQGGLLDVAIDPSFATNHLIYWSYAEPRDGGTNNTAVARGRLVEDGTRHAWRTSR